MNNSDTEQEISERVENYSKTSVIVKFHQEGIHAFKDALTNERYADVSFLGHPHRHIFHYNVEIEVRHDNRDIEFIQFKRELQNYVRSNNYDCNNKSCEMLAKDLAKYIMSNYNNRWLNITVSEDGENAARLRIN